MQPLEVSGAVRPIYGSLGVKRLMEGVPVENICKDGLSNCLLDFDAFYFLTYLFTYFTQFMKQSPSWEANRFSASQEIIRILWNQNVHYRIHKCPPPVPNLSQLLSSPYPHIPFHEDSSIILSSHLRLGLPSGLFPSGSPVKTLYTPLLSPVRATCPAHLILLDWSIRHDFLTDIKINGTTISDIL